MARTKAPKPDDITLGLRWSEEFIGQWEDEGATFVYSIGGDVIDVESGDIAGKFSAYYIDLEGLVDADVSVFDAMDGRQTTHDYYAALIDDPVCGLVDEVQALTGGAAYGNLLILDRLELLPQYRGMGHGLLLIREMIRRFGHGASVVAIQPFPLQYGPHSKPIEDESWSAQLDLHRYRRAKTQAVKRLRDHYAQLGFKSVGKTGFMVLATDNQLSWRGRGER